MEKNYITEVLIKEFKEDFDEFWAEGLISRATKLKNAIGGDEKNQIRDDVLPAYFYGNLFSEIVSVNYNPGIPSREMQTVDGLKAKDINCFEDYYNWLYNFGKYRYGEDSTNLIADPFDKKQLAYMLPFEKKIGKFNFEILENENATYNKLSNLEKLFSNRCQLELIPYGSQKFNPNDYKNKPITYEYFKRLLEIIFAVKRKVIFFNGSLFYEIIDKLKDDNLILSEIKAVRLIGKNNTEIKNKYHYATCMIRYNGQEIKCIINHALPMVGFMGNLPEQYAKKIIENEFNNTDKFNE